MANEEVKFSRGAKSSMPEVLTPGTILIATDTGEVYLDNTDQSRIQLKDSTKLPLSGGALTGPINMQSNKITNVPNPNSDSDVANLGSVKAQIKSNEYSSGQSIVVDNESHTISHSNIGTTGTVGPDGNKTLTYGGTFNVPQITTDGQGHVSSKTDRVITLPSESTYSGSNGITVTGHNIIHNDYATASTVGPTSDTSPGYGGSISVPQITINDQGHVTELVTRTITLPTAQDIPEVETYTGESPITVLGTTISHDNIGSAGTVGPATDDTLSFGDKITVPQITVDAKGHVSSKYNRNITIPSAPTSVSGNAGSATKLQTSRTIDGTSFDGSSDIMHYGTCSTSASTATKVVACEGFEKVVGARIIVKFTVTNTASSPALNVNSTGGSPIYYNGIAMPASVLAANKIYEFVFTGTNYELIGDRDTNSVYTSGTGISISDNVINHSNSIQASTIGQSASTSASPGDQISIPYISYDSQGHVTSGKSNQITLDPNILDVNDIISVISNASNNTTVLGAKVVADAINNLTDSINTLNTKLQNITATSGNTVVSGSLSADEIKIGNMKIVYDSESSQLAFEPIS